MRALTAEQYLQLTQGTGSPKPLVVDESTLDELIEMELVRVLPLEDERFREVYGVSARGWVAVRAHRAWLASVAVRRSC